MPALYHKYRPGSFHELIGQAQVSEPLMRALDAGRLHHAYLLSGPRGCGKTSTARILARSINCVNGPTSTPCGVCESCVALAPGGPGSLDVIEIDAATHNGVDDARDLRESVFFAPVSSRWKIYIIDEAHMVTAQAFNALLKVIEEPPPSVCFIFATTDPERILTTIKSRTFHYRLRLLPSGEMAKLLSGICAAEGVEVDPNALSLIIRAGGGSARDAESLLDQLLAASVGGKVTYADAATLLGFTDTALLEQTVEAMAARDVAAAFAAADRAIESGTDPRRYAEDLLQCLRDLLVLHEVPNAGETGLIDLPADTIDRMLTQAPRIGPAAMTRAADVLATALTDMRGTTPPRLVLELAMARILVPGAHDDPTAVLARLDEIERRSTTDLNEALARIEQLERLLPAAAREPVSADVLTPESLEKAWDDVLEAVRRKSPVAAAQLEQCARIAGLAGTTLTLTFQPAAVAEQFEHRSHLLVEALREVFGRELEVVCTGAVPS
jgi:DNA polymerase-3 subunit gamma/tau